MKRKNLCNLLQFENVWDVVDKDSRGRITKITQPAAAEWAMADIARLARHQAKNLQGGLALTESVVGVAAEGKEDTESSVEMWNQLTGNGAV